MDEQKFFEWRYSLERNLSLVGNEEEMVFCLREAVPELGFDRFSCVISHVVPFVDKRVQVIGDFPESLADFLLKSGLVLNGSVVGLCAGNNGVVAWRGSDICSKDSEFEVLSRIGIDSGVSCLVYPARTVAGIFSMARSGCNVSGAECALLKCGLRQIALLVSDRLMSIRGFGLVNKLDLLSSREIQVIRCVADGGTSKKVARLLSISNDTVNFHLKNIFKKLGVRNKAQAAAYAAIYGLI